MDKYKDVRERKICDLWGYYAELSNTLPAEEWTAEDLDLWGMVTKHSAVQNRLAQHMKEKGEDQ